MMKIKSTEYTNQDPQGSYTVRLAERIIKLKFVGFLNKHLVDKFCADLTLVLDIIEWDFWGYYADLTECDEQSSQTNAVLVNLYKRFIQQGCVVDAYNVENPATIQNIACSRQAAGIPNDHLTEHIFSNQQQAIEFIYSTLAKQKTLVADN